jgi:hypothetical protein
LQHAGQGLDILMIQFLNYWICDSFFTGISEYMTRVGPSALLNCYDYVESEIIRPGISSNASLAFG